MNEAKKQILNKTVDEWLEFGLIKPCTGPWAFNTVIRPKSDGSFRVTVDYTELNDVTVKDRYPIARIDQILCSLADGILFIKSDLVKAYHQIPIKSEDQVKTAFITPRGLYMNVTLIDGLCNAPSSFHRVTDKVFGDLKQTHSPTYFDDVITKGNDSMILLDNYEQLLDRLATNHFTIHPNK
ncbi:unnamed protein product, partial [Allacma fusca]